MIIFVAWALQVIKYNIVGQICSLSRIFPLKNYDCYLLVKWERFLSFTEVQIAMFRSLIPTVTALVKTLAVCTVGFVVPWALRL